MTKGYSGYKKVKVEVPWEKVVATAGGKREIAYYHPITNEVKWFCEVEPEPKTYSRYESVAEVVQGIKPVPMRTSGKVGWVNDRMM